MGHPLMNREEAVLNDFSIGQKSKLHIITGSNMSGKSTFLRTLGLNMVLAQIGAPVFAKEFVCKPVRILTSFHHIDSLHENSSYFYSELKSLHEIIISLEEQIPALVLLDEVNQKDADKLYDGFFNSEYEKRALLFVLRDENQNIIQFKFELVFQKLI